MTIRNFEALFHPRAIALIGASNREGAVGEVLARNLLSSGFAGELMFVNPHEDAIAGVKAYGDVAALPHAPDLAIIATPASTVAPLIADLGARGCRAAIVISAGDATFRQSVLQASAPHLMRIMGPNCLGFLSPGAGINASFAQLTPKAGAIALVTQSGAIATSLLDWAAGRGLGFSHVLSLGDMADIDFGDALDYLALDPATKAILLYVEQITSARKFMSAARIAARMKPVIVVKSGRSKSGAAAAASHTGALAGSDAVYDAAFRRAGMLRVDTLRDLFDAVETLASGLRPAGDRLMIVSNGGGLGVLAADALEANHGRLAPLSGNARSALDAVLPPQWSHANPVDILGDAHGQRYEDALAILATDSESDALLVMNCPTGVADNADAARAAARVHQAYPHMPMLACWAGGAHLTEPQTILAAAALPTFDAPEEAVRAFTQLVDYARNQRALLETPALAPERAPGAPARVDAIINAARGAGRTLLSEAEAKEVLAAYDIAVTPTSIAKDPAEAARAALGFGGRIALKILSRDISHKTDAGGVMLSLAPADVEAAAKKMLTLVAAARPDAHIDGFTVQPMIERPHTEELILGASVDPTFGPVLLFGQGGVAVEIIADRVMALPPLNSTLARDLITRTRVARLLAGYRDREPADLGAIAAALASLSDLIVNHPDILELDINPLLADANGVIALDARIVIASKRGARAPLAIRPYPAALSHQVQLADGACLQVRALAPSDATLLLEMGQRTSPQDLRLRFHGAVRTDSIEGAARLCQLDYDREMALAAFAPDGAIAGVARISFDPQFETGEFAIIVRSDLQMRGIGRALLTDILDYAKSRGVRTAWGDVLPDNAGMLAFVRELGARVDSSAGGQRVVFILTASA